MKVYLISDRTQSKFCLTFDILFKLAVDVSLNLSQVDFDNQMYDKLVVFVVS